MEIFITCIHIHPLPALLSLFVVFSAFPHCPVILSTSVEPLLGRISQDISSFLTQ